nr:hypothetical protein [Candidatus Baldrarchaeota archaeon]
MAHHVGSWTAVELSGMELPSTSRGLGAQLPSPVKAHGNWHPSHKYFTETKDTKYRKL